MPGEPFRNVLRYAHRLAAPHAGLGDEQLLARFAAVGDEAAFELLLRRHGGMILGLCRRVSRNEQDAEDAFQATFLALARKARSITRRAALGSWLYKVAYRAALAARKRTLQRAALEVPLTDVPGPDSFRTVESRDLGPVLDAEINCLPERYRVPFVLCHLEGKTLAEVARLLGRSRATIGTRLTRARQRLRTRLTRRGLGLSAVAAVFVTERVASATLRSSLVGATLAAATGTAKVPAPVAALTQGVLHAMIVSKLKAVTAVILVAATLGGGVGGLTFGMYADDGPRPADQRAAAAQTPRLVLRGWGTAIDPDGDCKFTIAKDALTITVPGADHALCVEQNRMNAPRVLRSVEGDFIAQVKVSGQFPKGAKSLVPSRRAFHGAGLLLLQDSHNYVRLERAALVADGENASYASWELRKGGEFVRAGDTGDLSIPNEPIWLRLERRGAKLYGSASPDGVSWTTLEPMAVELPHKLLVGVIAGQNTSTSFAPTFEGFQLFQVVQDQ